MINFAKLGRVYEAIRNDPNFSHLQQLNGINNPLIEGEGDNPIAMIIGEAPGAQEVVKKRPFVGPAGVMLRRLMAIAGLHSTYGAYTIGHPLAGTANCWLTNVVKYRPQRNRTPTLEEIHNSRKYLRLEWEAIGKPDIIITVGSPALTAVTGRKQSILAKGGRMFTNHNNQRDPEVMVFWPMIHPSFGLRNEHVRPTIEKHWIRLGEWLANHPRLNSR